MRGGPFERNLRSMVERFNTICCYDCSRPIRWWNRRIWLVENQSYTHLRCWEDQLFFKTLVAGHIQFVLGKANDNPADSTNLPAGNDKQPHASATQPKPEKPQVILLQPSEEVVSASRLGRKRRNRDSLATSRWYSLARLARRPRPHPRLCNCGAIEFSEKSSFCTQCGSSL